MASSSGPAFLSPFQVNRSQTAQWKQIIRQSLVDLRCAATAFLVEDMDVATQNVTVQISIQERVRTNAGAKWYDVPPIIKVPVVIPRGGGFSVTLPLKKYDEGLLIFCDTCFDYWWQNGRNNAPVADNNSSGTASGTQRQLEVRRHHVHDCGFIPGMYSQPNVLSGYSADTLQVRSDDGATVIDVATGGVTITGASTVVKNSVGPAQTLMTDAFFQYWVTEILPFLQSKGYVGPPPPSNSETIVLKGQ